MQHCRSGRTKKQDDTNISKNSGNKTDTTKITDTVLWQFFNTDKFNRNINYSTLLLYRIVLKQKGIYHSYTKTIKHFTDQIQDDRSPPSILKNPASGSKCFNTYISQKKPQKTTLPVCIVEHFPQVVQQCFFVGCTSSCLVSYHCFEL